jgi:glycosyltransferase involved in cell wall biosynthesis
VVIEAAACGTPTIVTAVGGLPEAVAGLDRTLIVPPADAPALATRLGEAAWDRPTRRATRAHAERFDWSAVAERHRGVLRRVAARAGRDDRLRVVYLDHVAQLSGGEIALLRLLPHLDRVQPHVLLAEDGPLVAELHLAGISTEVLAMAPKARELRKDEVADPRSAASVAATTAAYVLRLARRLRQLQPDVVHANSLKAGVYGSLACRLARVPLVWHVRDRVAEDYLPPRAIGLVRGLVQHVPAAVIANSQATMDTIVTRAPAPGTWKVIPDPVGSATVPSRATGDPTTYGMLGRLAPWKGQDLFLRAFAHAFPQGTERAVVVGGALFGEDRYAGSLTSLSRRLGIADRVEFRGFRADVWDELARLDVLVHASTTPEPFGQVITEGMAAGVPVVASGAGGPLEIIDHERTGLLFPPNDERGLAGAMRRMLDPALRERLRSAGRDEVRRYEPAAVATTVQDVYETVATRRRPS